MIIANAVTTASTLSASVAPVLKLIFAANAATIAIVMIASRLTTRPVLEYNVRVAEETSNRSIECPVLARLIDSAVSCF